jgi:hypothetical protein
MEAAVQFDDMRMVHKWLYFNFTENVLFHL